MVRYRNGALKNPYRLREEFNVKELHRCARGADRRNTLALVGQSSRCRGRDDYLSGIAADNLEEANAFRQGKLYGMATQAFFLAAVLPGVPDELRQQGRQGYCGALKSLMKENPDQAAKYLVQNREGVLLLHGGSILGLNGRVFDNGRRRAFLTATDPLMQAKALRGRVNKVLTFQAG